MLSNREDEPVPLPAPSAPPVGVDEVRLEPVSQQQWPAVSDFSGVAPLDYRADLEEEPSGVSRLDSFYPRGSSLSPRYEPPALPREEEADYRPGPPVQPSFTTELPAMRTASPGGTASRQSSSFLNLPGGAQSRQSSTPGRAGEATPFLGVVAIATGGPGGAPSATSPHTSARGYGTVTIADLDGRPSMGGKPQPTPIRSPSDGNNAGPIPPNAMMLPVPQPRPWFGYMMCLSCIAGFTVSMVISGGFAPLDVNPLFGPTPAALVKAGAKVTALIIPPSNQWWRLVTPLWLHAGIVHLLANGHMLLKMGFELEKGIGSFKFAALYILSSIFSMSCSAVFSVPVVTVGASGALFGVLGAILAELCGNQHLLTKKERCKHFCGIGLTILLNLAVGIFPLVDNWAHLGGLLAGILLGSMLIMHRDPSRNNKFKFRQICCGVFSGVLFVLLQALLIVCLYLKYDAAVFCPFCKYISCVPVPAWTCYYQQTP